ncbi:MAG: hypothetical protein AAF846_29890 [Chloroflexota bacterium]
MVTQSTYYIIVVQGHLGTLFQNAFAHMACLSRPDGTTRMTGYLPDQAAVFGILNTIERLGLTLVSIQAQEQSV